MNVRTNSSRRSGSPSNWPLLASNRTLPAGSTGSVKKTCLRDAWQTSQRLASSSVSGLSASVAASKPAVALVGSNRASSVTRSLPDQS